jgi:ABC-type proline/glycine betaine transport system permease subunit
MLLFMIFFGGAIYYRKRPAEHKTLMLMTAINFVGAAVARIPFLPEKSLVFFVVGIPILLAITCLVWFTAKHRRLNKVFAAAVFLFIVSVPLRIIFANSSIWLNFVGRLAA